MIPIALKVSHLSAFKGENFEIKFPERNYWYIINFFKIDVKSKHTLNLYTPFNIIFAPYNMKNINKVE